MSSDPKSFAVERFACDELLIHSGFTSVMSHPTAYQRPAETADSSGGDSHSLSNLSLLLVSPAEPSLIGLTLQLDRLGCVLPQIRWVSSSHAAAAVLRDESYDCVIVSDCPRRPHGIIGCVEVVPAVSGLRAGGFREPVIVVSDHLRDIDQAAILREDGDILVTSQLWESPALLPLIHRCLTAGAVRRENHRLSVSLQRRSVRERDEAEQLLNQQREIVRDLIGGQFSPGMDPVPEAAGDSSPGQGTDAGVPGIDAGRNSPGAGAGEVPHDPRPSVVQEALAQVSHHYRELLRTHVIMGSGSLAVEIERVAGLLAMMGLSAREVMRMHLEQVEAVVSGLGNRSARHVVARADLLAMELMVHLADRFRSSSDTGLV